MGSRVRRSTRSRPKATMRSSSRAWRTARRSSSARCTSSRSSSGGSRRSKTGALRSPRSSARAVTRGARALLLSPYVLLLLVFFAAPLALMLVISVSRQSFGEMEWTITFHHYARFFSDGFYLGVLWDTLLLGAIVTVVSLLL